jgi:hypothetical protein
MSLRQELQAVIRLQLAQTELGDQAVQAALAGEQARGTPKAVFDMLVAYCTGLENALLVLADTVDDLLGNGEGES